MSDFIDEIEQDLKQEKFDRRIKKIVPIALFVIITILVATSIFVFTSNNKLKTEQQVFQQIHNGFKLLEENDKKAALEIFSKAYKSSNTSYSALAGFEAAIIENDKSSALNLYKEIAANSSFDEVVRDKAKFLFASKAYDKKNNDQTEIFRNLDELINSKGAYKFNAMELKASILLDQDRQDEAKIIFKNIRDDSLAPKNIRKNAEAIISIYWKKL